MKTDRSFLSLVAIVSGVLALAGCGKSPAPAPSNIPQPATSPLARGADEEKPADTGEPKELNIFCWSEYVPQSVIDRFTKQTGIKVNIENYASNEEMLSKLLAGGGKYDIIQPTEYVVEALIKEKLLHPLDPGMIDNLSNIAPEFRNMQFDPGNLFSVPWMAGTVGIVVNTAIVRDDIKGYKDVFQEKYKNKIVVLDDAREIVTWALSTEGIDANDINDANLAKVKPLVAKWLPLVRVYDSDSPKTSLLNGDVALGVVWSGEGAILLNQDKKFKWVIPQEGTHLFVDSLCIPKDAKHPKNAQLFMNFILRPRISKLVSDEFPYLNPNLEARKLMTSEQLNNAASFPPPDEIVKMHVFRDIGARGSVIDEMITTLKVQ